MCSRNLPHKVLARYRNIAIVAAPLTPSNVLHDPTTRQRCLSPPNPLLSDAGGWDPSAESDKTVVSICIDLDRIACLETLIVLRMRGDKQQHDACLETSKRSPLCALSRP
jgi:hypothetical protein